MSQEPRHPLPTDGLAAGGPSLASLLRPVAVDAFLADYWELSPLHVARGGDTAAYAELIDLPIEEILWRSCRDWGEIRLGGPKIAEVGDRFASRPPRLPGLRQALEEGCTLVVNDMQLKDRSVALLCRAIERDLSCRANVNLYITGPGRQGLAMHYDDEDVLVLQIAGSKSWRVIDGPSTLPMRDSPYQEDDSADPQARDYLLEEGDLLYIPRGLRHSAAATDLTSRHLTVSLRTVTWRDLLDKLVAAAAETDPALRRSVPLDRLRGGGAGLFGDLLGSLERKLAQPALWRRAVSAVREELLQGAENLLTEKLEPAPLPEDFGGLRFQVAPDQIHFLAGDGDPTLQATAGTFEFPAAMRPLVSRLCDGRPFIPDRLPGPASDKARRAVVRRLYEQGFLVLV
jgi:hypothetical protein